MARLISKLPYRPKKRRGDYPWDEWMDGKAREMVKGEDFECGVLSFQQMVLRKGREMGLRVVTQVDGERVCVQAVVA